MDLKDVLVLAHLMRVFSLYCAAHILKPEPTSRHLFNFDFERGSVSSGSMDVDMTAEEVRALMFDEALLYRPSRESDGAAKVEGIQTFACERGQRKDAKDGEEEEDEVSCS